MSVALAVRRLRVERRPPRLSCFDADRLAVCDRLTAIWRMPVLVSLCSRDTKKDKNSNYTCFYLQNLFLGLTAISFASDLENECGEISAKVFMLI